MGVGCRTLAINIPKVALNCLDYIWLPRRLTRGDVRGCLSINGSMADQPSENDVAVLELETSEFHGDEPFEQF
jgi:hypothetical protein